MLTHSRRRRCHFHLTLSRSDDLFVFCSFFHNPCSGLAGVLFEKLESTPRNTYDVPVLQLLANTEGLDFCRSNLIGCFYDFEYRVFHPIRDNQIAHLWIVLFTVCHAHSFPQAGIERYPCGFQTAPLPQSANICL